MEKYAPYSSSSELRDSDLACERKKADLTLPGVEERHRTCHGVDINEIRITSDEGEKSIGKPKGRYITVSHMPAWALWDRSREDLICAITEALRDLSRDLADRTEGKRASVLVVGLGNRFMTADAIGPRTVDAISATGHLKQSDPALFEQIGCSSLYVISPGVTAQTGIETVSQVCDCAKRIKPDLVVVIDALAARSTERLATTIQLCDSGVEPGSGVGGHHLAITRENTGAPVIVIGVPTVVSSRTMLYDALSDAGAADAYLSLEKHMKTEAFFVSPKDIDIVCDRLSGVISSAINRLWGVPE